MTDASERAEYQPGGDEWRAAVQLTIGFFAFTLLVFITSGFLRGNVREVLQMGLPMMVVDGLIAFQLVFVLRWTAPLGPWLRWSLVAVAVLVVACLQSLWDTQLRVWAGTIDNNFGSERVALVRAATLNTYNAGMYTALLAFQSALLRLRENQRLLIAAQASERDAHLLALRFQLNPHFLFNTLNAISSLVVTRRGDDAELMIERLSAFLRASLAADPKQMTSLAEEFEMLETYLQIEAVRFGERLVPVLELPDELACLAMPPFLLQPLVENAIKYAVAPSREPVEIHISAAADATTLHLVVADTGAGRGASSGTGVGLANVRERIALAYGSAGALAAGPDAQGWRVTISIPRSDAAG